MSFDTGWASLHAGLIQRARPARPVVSAPAALAPAEPAIRTGPAAPAPVHDPVLHAPEPRYGLTVRVGWRVRTLLFRIRRKTGRTTQSILHDALVQYLAGLESGSAPR